MENTALTVQGTQVIEDGMIVQLTGEKKMSYCSMTPKTMEEKINLFNAINGAEKRLAEEVNTEILVKHVFVEEVECINEQTGEATKCPRTVLIDVNGVGYTAVSVGVFSSLRQIFSIFGSPETWKAPVKIVPKQISKGSKKITTLSIRA